VYDEDKEGQQTIDDLEYIANIMYSGINLNLITGSVTKAREVRDYLSEEQ